MNKRKWGETLANIESGCRTALKSIGVATRGEGTFAGVQIVFAGMRRDFARSKRAFVIMRGRL